MEYFDLKSKYSEKGVCNMENDFYKSTAVIGDKSAPEIVECASVDLNNDYFFDKPEDELTQMELLYKKAIIENRKLKAEKEGCDPPRMRIVPPGFDPSRI